MKKIVIFLTLVIFAFSFTGIVTAQNVEGERIKAEIHRHRQAIERLKSQLKQGNQDNFSESGDEHSLETEAGDEGGVTYDSVPGQKKFLPPGVKQNIKQQHHKQKVKQQHKKQKIKQQHRKKEVKQHLKNKTKSQHPKRKLNVGSKKSGVGKLKPAAKPKVAKPKGGGKKR